MPEDKLKPCPFRYVMIVGETYKGWSNIIHITSGVCIIMANPEITKDFIKLIQAWDRMKDEV